MELTKTAYKQTVVGLIPDNWEIIDLSEAVEFLDGQRRPIKASERKSGDYPYYGASGIIDYVDNYIFNDELILLGEDGENILSRNLPLAFIVSGKVWVNNHAHVMKPNKDFNIYFLTEFLESLDYSLLNSGTAQPKLNKQSCLKIKVVKPPLQEQQAIATALSDVDTLIGELDALIEKKKAIKKGAMQQLLTPPHKGGKRLPGFEGEWEEKILGRIGNTYGGLSGKSKKDFEDGTYPYITFLNVMKNTIINCSIFEHVHVKIGEFQNKVKKGDILFNTSSETPEEVGMCALLNDDIEDLYLNSFCFGYRLSDESNIDELFFTYLINSDVGRKLFLSLAQGATRYNLSKNNFNKLIIEIPSRDEQRAIAMLLMDMEQEIKALLSKKFKVQEIKQGMMQELLTGKTRLV